MFGLRCMISYSSVFPAIIHEETRVILDDMPCGGPVHSFAFDYGGQ